MKRPFVLPAMLFVLTNFAAAEATEWTRFRGPNGTGVGNADSIPLDFTAADFNCKTKLPGGSGCSSPVIWKDKAFVLSANADDATRYVVCINAITGKTVSYTHLTLPTTPYV